MSTKTEERKIKILLDGTQVNASLKQMESAAGLMNSQLKAMGKDDPGRQKLKKDLVEMRGRIKDTKDELNGVQKASLSAKLGLNGITSASGLMRAGFQAAVAAFLPLLAFQSIIELGRNFLGLVNHVDQVKGSLQQLTGVQGEALDDMYVRVQAISKTFDEDYNEVIKGANVLMKEFGLSHQEAFDLMEKGYLSGANASGEMLEQIKEYSTQFAVSGASAEEFLSILAMGEKQGIFSDKAADTVKEFGLRIREQTKATGEAMDAAFGQEFTDKLFKGINDGSTTTMEALRQVSKQMNDTTIPANQLQTVIADVFGGPGEDAGIAFLQQLHQVGDGLDTMADKTNILTSAQLDQLEAEKDLATAQAELGETFAGTGATLSWLWTNIQTVGLIVINAFILSIKQIRNQAVGLGYAFASIGESFVAAWDALKNGNLSGMADAFSNMGKNAEKAFWDGARSYDKQAEADREKLNKQEEAKAVAAATEKAKKEAEATRLEKEKAAKKAAADEKKRQDERAKNELEAEKNIQALKNELIADEFDRKIAQLRTNAEREKEAAKGRDEQIAEQRKLIEEALTADILAIEQDRTAKKEKEAEEQRKKQEEEGQKQLAILARTAQAKADLEVLIASKKSKSGSTSDIDAYEQALLNQLEVERVHQLANAELTANEKLLLEAQFEQKKFDIKEQFAEAARNMEMAKAQDVLQNMMQATNILFDFKKIANDKEMARLDGDQQARLDKLEKEYAAGRLSKEQYENSKSSIEANYGEKTRALKRKAAQDEKKANIANSVMAGALAVLKASQNQLGMLSPTAIMTAIFAGLQTAKIIATPIPAFATGGLTASFKNGGMVNNASIGLIGEAGAEWVMPNWMMRSPKYANTYKWLETERQGGPGRAFAEGGNTANVPQDVNAAPDASAQLANNILLLRSDLAAYHGRIEQWATDLRVNYSAGAAEEVMELRSKVKQNGGW